MRDQPLLTDFCWYLLFSICSNSFIHSFEYSFIHQCITHRSFHLRIEVWKVEITDCVSQMWDDHKEWWLTHKETPITITGHGSLSGTRWGSEGELTTHQLTQPQPLKKGTTTVLHAHFNTRKTAHPFRGISTCFSRSTELDISSSCGSFIVFIIFGLFILLLDLSNFFNGSPMHSKASRMYLASKNYSREGSSANAIPTKELTEIDGD